MIAFYDQAKGFGFACPAGVDPADKSRHLYVSVHALRRAGSASLNKGDRIEYRKEVPKYAGRKSECQDIMLLEATP